MPKMSIKKKQPISRNPISRKKLFQFLFKNYIKSAYQSGISKLQIASSGGDDSSSEANSPQRKSSSSSSGGGGGDGKKRIKGSASSDVAGVKKVPASLYAGGGSSKRVAKKEIRSEYFNDMSECYTTASQRKRSAVVFLGKDSTSSVSVAKLHRKIGGSSSSSSGGGSGVVGCTASARLHGASIRRNMTVTQPADKKFDQNEENVGWGKETTVNLVRDPSTSFGVCIVGGKVSISKETQVSGIFIKNVIPGSPAALSKQIKIGDRILSVNEQDVRHATQEEAIGLIKNAGCSIKLVLQSFAPKDEENKDSSMSSKSQPTRSDDAKEDATMATDVTTEPANQTTEVSMETTTPTAITTTTKPVYSSSDDDDDEDEEETAGKVVTKAGFEIDRKSAGNMKRTKEEAAADEEPENNYGYTEKKLKKKYGPLGQIIRAYIQRDGNNSMGLALAGHRDRTKMGCYVAGINPKGSASSQNVKVGDEICEINGIFLHKLCHLNASVLIKGIPGATLEFILLRKPNSADEIAVKPVLSFPSAFDQFDQLYSCFKNVRNVTIQKVGTSLGIMIIEGKHSDVGQGIFISDIQENSNAENAGVKIGEMILAVNKDLLIDTNYDTAAGLLKRAEGIVTLTLCNPNKKDEPATGVKPIEETAVKIEEAKKPEPPVVPEVPKDPATAEIIANKETFIELNADCKPLGIVVVKGDSSQVQVGASIIVIHPNGAVSKDGRLQVFDKIIEIDGKKISSETSDNDLKNIFQHLYGKLKLTIYRGDPVDIKEMEVDVTKKSGKDMGMSFAECKNNGIYVTEILPGGIIDMDHRMIKGDIITHINGDDIRKSDFIESSIMMKAAQPKITFKVIRPKGKK